MLLLTTIFLLLSNAVNLQRDVSILNSQIAIFAIIYSMWSIYNQFYYLFMATGIAVFNGLFFINLYTMLFSQFLLILCFSILFLTAFKHVKINVATVKKSYFELSDQSKAEFNSFYENTIKYIYHIRKHKLDPIYPNYLQDPKLDIPSEDFLIPVTSLTFSENDENGKKRLPWEHLDAELSYTSRSLTEERPDTKNFENVNNNEMYTITEYPLIILFIIIGSIFLMSSADLLSVFLSVELQSYGLYLLSSSFRNSETATGGGLTYFLLGGLSSTFILLGASFIYANCGNTLLENLYIISDLSQQNIINNNLSNKLTQRAEGLVNYGMEERYDLWYNSYYLHLSLVMAGVGFLFKISAAPFHFWSPDVYDAIPTVVTTFVAIIAKISIFIFLLDLVYYTSKTLQTINFNWTIILLVSCLLSLVIGSVLGLTQERIKRLYAYSTISHIGFILLALAICSVESIQSYFFYIMQYSLSNLNAFLLLLVIGYTIRPYLDEKKVDKLKNTKITELSDKNSKLMHMIEGTSPLGDEKAQNTNQLSETQKLDQLPDKANSPIQLVSQLKGYSAINPMLALSLIITLFSFIGVPPLLGFFAKQMVLSAALDKGYIFIALVAILTSVISAVYYLSVVKNIYFDEVDESKWKFSKDKFSFKIPFKGSSEALTLDKTEPFYLRNRIAINWNILFIVRQKAREFTARLYSFETDSVEYKNQPIGPLNIIISSLSILILLFMFTPVEWLNLSSILSLSLFYF